MKYLIEVNCGDESTGNINVVYAVEHDSLTKKEIEHGLTILVKTYIITRPINSKIMFLGSLIEFNNFVQYGELNTFQVFTLDEFWQSKRRT